MRTNFAASWEQMNKAGPTNQLQSTNTKTGSVCSSQLILTVDIRFIEPGVYVSRCEAGIFIHVDSIRLLFE